MYEAQVSRRFMFALERLPYIKTITIQASSNSQSYLYGEFMSWILMEL